MDCLEIVGGLRLKGTVPISGAKNAALPIMAAALLTEGRTVLHNVPDLADVSQMAELLRHLGVLCEHDSRGSMVLEVLDDQPYHANYELVSKMRASVCVMGPLVGRRMRARVSMPGGCAIGDRPIDLHIKGLQALGARYELVNGDVMLSADQLNGTELFLGGPFGSSVTATMNVMTCAALAKGTTVIESAACEPEVVDVADFLIACGAHIRGAGSPRIVIEGVKQLHGCEYKVLPDRIEAGTYMIAAAMTSGDLFLQDARIDHLHAAAAPLRQIGVIVEPTERGIQVASGRRLMPTQLTSQPYPGFPTDLQAQMMALLCLADGNSVITEKIFPDRFLHVGELNRLGGRVRKEGPTAIIEGIDQFIGAPVMASDLRASAALVLAALNARGTTRISRVYHIDRGYEKIEQKLSAVGANIRRRNEKED